MTFKTDSPFVALLAEMTNIGEMPHFTMLGSCGFDLYADGAYYRSFLPNYGVKDGYASIIISFPAKAIVPTSSAFFLIYRGRGAVYRACTGQSDSFPTTSINLYRRSVYYGSSIMRGECASRPGSAYPALIIRMDRIDFINLDFSGNTLGETAMAEYIGGLSMSAFVLDRPVSRLAVPDAFQFTGDENDTELHSFGTDLHSGRSAPNDKRINQRRMYK